MICSAPGKARSAAKSRNFIVPAYRSLFEAGGCSEAAEAKEKGLRSKP
jgi:hypothetical protein